MSKSSTSMSPLHFAMKRVGIIGSGNWGTTIARVIAENLQTQDDFDKTVKMWVFDEIVDGQSLIKIINEKHENVKYLPGYKLPETIIATGDIGEVSRESDYLIFVIPHQFIHETVRDMVGLVKPTAVGISLVKGIAFNEDKIELVTDEIERLLHIRCGSLMGANIANDIAAKEYCESTLAFPDEEVAKVWLRILSCYYFHVEVIADIVGQQVCGTLKNIVALAGGLVDGLGFGQSTKAAILRQGFVETFEFAKFAFPGRGVDVSTMMASCGFGDIVASSYGGRNRLCAEYFAKTGIPFHECEAKLLNGQKLQGTLSAGDVYKLLKMRGALKDFPFFTTMYLIVLQKVKPDQIFHPVGPHLDIDIPV